MKILKLKYLCLVAVAICVVATSCTKLENPLSLEQYKKTVYLVGANQQNNQGLQIVNLPYKASATDAVDTYISVASGGSQLIDKNLTVQIAEAGSGIMQQYNSMYLYKPTDIKYQQLGSVSYNIPGNAVQLNAGQVYANMPIKINTATLHCDSLYALSFRISSLSDPGYAEIRKTDSVLLFSFNLYNDYSGSYQETGRYYKTVSTPLDTVSLSLSRTFKAVNFNTIRFYHLTTTESVLNVSSSGVSVKINSDNTLTITPWGSLMLTAGSGTYDPAKKTFTVAYAYTEAGVSYQFRGTFIKSI